MRGIAWDLETGSAKETFSFGPGFIRLCGWAWIDNSAIGPVQISTDPAELVAALRLAEFNTGHHVTGFDLLALAVHGYISFDEYETLCRKSFDTLLVDRHLDPVAAQGAQPKGYYRLNETALRYGVTGKVDEIERLARKWGGYHLIPQDDPDYVRYLHGDVNASAELFRAMSARLAEATQADRAYIRREHHVAAIMGRITLEGFRVDVDFTMQKWSEGQARLEAGKQLMHEKYGMPTTGKKPHVSKAGKVAFRAAILGTGISEDALRENWPINGDKSLSTAKDVLNGMIEVFTGRNDDAAELCRTVKAMNGERTVWATILDHLVDGKVHPKHATEQASGRVSVTEPGLTVQKKSERGGMLPDNDDEWLVAVDGSQIDARMVAAISGDTEYQKLFGPGLDMHSEIALRVWNSPECKAEMARNNGKCDCRYRKLAKVGGHSWNYGANANSLSRNLGIDLKDAQRFDRGMTESFPRLVQWKSEVREEAGVLGYGEEAPEGDTYRVLTNPFGRSVRVERSRAYTQSVGLLCQSATRDSMMHGIMQLPPHYRRKIKVFVHDEILVSVRKDRAEEISHEIAGLMAFDLLGVPITFSGGDFGPNWASCYE